MEEIRIATTQFPTAPEGDLEYCNGKPGSALAHWLRTRLLQSGYQCDEVIQEDYGWGFWIKEQDSPIWLCVGLQESEEDAVPGSTPEWAVFVKHDASPFNPKQWFKGKQGKSAEQKVFAEVQRQLSNSSDIKILEE